jgi:hypothetical protein
MDSLNIESMKSVFLGEYQNKKWYAVYDPENFLDMDWWYYGVDKNNDIEKVFAVAEIGVDEDDPDFRRFSELENRFGHFWGEKT